MNLFIPILAVIFSCCTVSFSQKSYFPHNVGDQWFYQHWNGAFFTTSNMIITKDSTSSDSSQFLFYDNFSTPELFIDSLNNVLRGERGYLIYKLDAEVGDVWKSNSGEFAWLSRIDSSSVFSEPTTIKVFQYGPIHPDSVMTPYILIERHLARGFGLIYEWTEAGYFSSLIGCIIKNDSIGITTSVEYQEEIPYHFKLYQNYPNPFNPITTISYQIPETEFITLKIFDVLGREVTVLVNEEKAAGNYTVNFNASGISSGVYFYSISAGNFKQIKKMILTK